MICEGLMTLWPKAALTTERYRWLIDSAGGGSTAAGMTVNATKALSYSAVWAAIRVLSTTLGSMPWRAFMQGDAPGVRVAQPDSAVDWLLHTEPNPDMSAISFRESLVACAVLFGNGYASITRNRRGEPVRLDPQPSNDWRPVRLDDGMIAYEHVNTRERIADRDMFVLRGMSGNGIVGYALLTYGKESIGLGLATQEFGARWFGNNAQAGGILKHPGNLEGQALQNLRESIERRHKGPDKAHKLLVLEEGMEWVSNQIPPEASQFLQTRTFQVNDVSRFTGVPPHMLAELSRATFSNIEEMGINFVTYALNPWAVRLESEANRKLFNQNRQTRSRMFTKINLNALMRGNAKARSDYYRALWNMGVLSINDIRRLEDMNPIGRAGMRRYVPVNMAELDDPGTAPARSAPARSEAIKKAQARTFVQAAELLIGKECKSIKRAAVSRQPFGQWCDTFYADHEPYVTSTLLPPAEALAELIGTEQGVSGLQDETVECVNTAVKLYAAEHCEDSRHEASEAYRTGSVDDLCELWTIQRPAKIAQALTDTVVQAAMISMKPEQQPEPAEVT